MLVVTVNERQGFVLSRDGQRVGFLDVTVRGDGRVRVAFEFPREIAIRRQDGTSAKSPRRVRDRKAAADE